MLGSLSESLLGCAMPKEVTLELHLDLGYKVLEFEGNIALSHSLVDWEPFLTMKHTGFPRRIVK